MPRRGGKRQTGKSGRVRAREMEGAFEVKVEDGADSQKGLFCKGLLQRVQELGQLRMATVRTDGGFNGYISYSMGAQAYTRFKTVWGTQQVAAPGWGTFLPALPPRGSAGGPGCA